MQIAPEKRIFCRFGEMVLKSKPVRRRFSRQLIKNMRDALDSLKVDYRIHNDQSYISVISPDPAAYAVLQRVFGISKLAEVISGRFTSLEEIVSRGYQHFRALVPGKTFAVRCRRIGTHGFHSRDVEVALGARLAQHGRVNLSQPEVTCRLEVRDQTLSLFSRNETGAGGLPLGTQGKALCLISGGIDSPVAAYYAMRRGLSLDYLFCCLGGPYQAWGPQKTAKHLADQWSFGSRPQFYMLDFTKILSAFHGVDQRYRNILLKRFFYRAADRIAADIGAEAIITGEVLGQVSSQTLSNLDTISHAARRLIIRPLITLDKLDITRTAEHIGTLDISEQVPEFCNVAARRPKTVSTETELEQLEKQLPANLMHATLETLTVFDLRSADPIPDPVDFQIDTIPSNALFVWIESGNGRQTLPKGISRVVAADRIREFTRSLPNDRPVVLACREGRLARDTSAYLREKGYEAYHFQQH